MTAVILSGGENRRIGRNKAFLDIRGTTAIELVIRNLKPLFRKILIVTKAPQDYRGLAARVVADSRKESGSLIGLYTGLRQSGSLHNFVIACDMPLLRRSPIEYMRRFTKNHDVVVPRPHGNYEPLFAFYSKRCIPAIEELLEAGNLRIFDFYPRVRVRAVSEKEIARFDPAGLSFMNINTMEDYQTIIREAAGGE